MLNTIQINNTKQIINLEELIAKQGNKFNLAINKGSEIHLASTLSYEFIMDEHIILSIYNEKEAIQINLENLKELLLTNESDQFIFKLTSNDGDERKIKTIDDLNSTEAAAKTFEQSSFITTKAPQFKELVQKEKNSRLDENKEGLEAFRIEKSKKELHVEANTIVTTDTSDTTPPKAPIVELLNDTGLQNQISADGKLKLSSLEENASVQFSLDGTTWFDHEPEFVYGENHIYVRQVDEAGHESQPTFFSFTYATGYEEANYNDLLNVDDLIEGSNIRQTIRAYGGDDTIYALGGDDRVVGGNGDDTIYGGKGNDSLTGDSGHDSIFAGEGNDKIWGGTGNDHINAGAGDDYWVKAGSGNDTVYLGEGKDVAYGDSGADLMYGEEGDDELFGGNDNDQLFGGLGNDNLHGDNGHDTIYGGFGNDKLYGGKNKDLLYGEDGNDYLNGGNQNDTLYGGEGDDLLKGGRDNDTLYGGNGDDRLYGEGHNDTLYGEDGNDYLVGAGWGDYLYGGQGDDIIEYYKKNLEINGGEGTDTLTLQANDGWKLGLGSMVQTTKISSIEILDIEDGLDDLVLRDITSFSVKTMTDQNNQLIIEGHEGQSVDLNKDWTYVNTTAGYKNYQDVTGAIQLLVNEELQVI